MSKAQSRQHATIGMSDRTKGQTSSSTEYMWNAEIEGKVRLVGASCDENVCVVTMVQISFS